MDTLLSRRAALKAAGAALIIPVAAEAQPAPPAPPPTAIPPGASPNAGPGRVTAFLRVGADGRVTVLAPVTEMGQGTHTAYVQIVADEIGLDPRQVAVEVAQPEGPFRYTPVNEQYSGASWGVRLVQPRLRRAAAQARAVLVQAASARLGLPADQLRIEDGRILHPASGRSLGIGEVAEAAGVLPLPENPALKPAAERRFVGRTHPRPDVPAKVRGAATFGSDVRLPGMLHAVAKLAPVHGAEMEGFDPAPARAVRGVVDVRPLGSRGAAVVAGNSWAALKGAEALAIRWKPTPHDSLDSAALSRAMHAALAEGPARVGKDEGDSAAALRGAARTVEATYEVPFLAHAMMETENCTVRIEGNTAEAWAPTQHQDWVRAAVAREAGVPPENVKVHTTFAGGGFGRRLMVEIAGHAASLAKAIGRPVKLTWPREEEFAQGYYRPAHVARLQAALDPGGRVTGLIFRSAGQSVMGDYRPGFMARGPAIMDPFALQAISDTRYRFGVFRAEWVRTTGPAKVWLWRSVGGSQNAFFMESFLDEVAHAAGKDPYALRRELLAHDARALRVLDTAAQRAGWGTPAPGGRHRGIAYCELYDSLVAQVAEVSVQSGQLRVHRVVVAIDCGEAVNPGQIEAQMQGSVVWALSSAWHEAATLRNGATEQRNFDAYRTLRMDEAPVVETHILTTPGVPVGGVGEPGVPCTAPAVCNAIFAATGKRIRTLPIAQHDLRA
ncbi:MAG TPA: molybdopterin cofactor-binding domain-containing protein [Acetobacteraceae bacterium]|nr:molybdopterin cofactor-binding domain-containing protein [Acetobacteraceae bacterium]